MFAAFGVLKSIKYCTAEQACEDLYNSGGDTRDISSDIAWGKKARCADSDTTKARTQVLLIDEVDVFFKDDFYGESFRSVTTLQQEAIRQLMQYIWKNRDDINKSSLAASGIAQTCLELFPKDIQPIISKHINSMLKDAKKLDSHDYIVSDGKICYKEFDGLTSRSIYGYLTAFAAMKEHENGRVTDDHLEYRLGISLNCGESSYAELGSAFDVLLGVTGTLKSLGNDVRDILTQQYGVKRTTYIPSVYGKNKLLFSGDNPRGKSYDIFDHPCIQYTCNNHLLLSIIIILLTNVDVIIADDDANFHLELCNEINTRRKPDKEGFPPRAVMVFFDSRQVMEAYYESDQLKMSSLKPITRVITEEIAPQDREGAFLQATDAGSITLMIREYGRGTDFKVYDNRMLEGGGVHVVQAFFSHDISEEIQIKGRAARQGTRGSYR